MDEMTIQTRFMLKIIEKFLESKIKKAMKRKIDISISRLYIRHDPSKPIEVHLTAIATMDEAELIALMNQVSNGKEDSGCLTEESCSDLLGY